MLKKSLLLMLGGFIFIYLKGQEFNNTRV